MSLDQLLQAQLPPKLEENKPVNPTLLVGLGGTGKEVLLRFRRLVVERYGSLAVLPFLQFMHVDTDGTAAAKEQYDLKAEDDPLYQEVRFQPNERVDLTIEGGTGKYLEHINNYPNIKRWFPTDGKIGSLGNLGEGAGQIRIASRLGFYHAPNFVKLASRLEQCKGLLRDASIMEKSAGLGFEFDPRGMNVFVIASFAGGTGSGTFLDMGFLLERYFPDADRIGIFLLPSFFQGYAGGERVRANGYAALMELNHYSFGHVFLADWDGVETKALPPPPYTNTYLIDGMNEAGLVIGSSGKEYDAYRMVAEALFQDYSIGKFSGMKRATRVNLENFNLNVYTHNFLNDELRTKNQGSNKSVVGDTYPTRFGSFGLATIAYPTARLQSACASRLAVRILEFWQQSLLESPLDALFTSFLTHPDVKFLQGRYERRDGGGILEGRDVEEALEWYHEGAAKTLPSYLWQKAQTIRTAVEAAAPGFKVQTLSAERVLLDQFLAKEDSDNPEDWGIGIRQIESNFGKYLERLKAGLEKRAAELADDPRYGVAYTLSLLRELKSLLHNETFQYAPHFDATLPVWRDEAQQSAFELDQLQIDIGNHERQFFFRKEDLKRDLERLVGTESAADPGVLYNYFYSRVMKQVARRGRQVCDEIDKFLGKDDPTGKGLLGRYYSLLSGFKKLKDRLHAKERYFARAERSELTINLYREGDGEEWYRTWMGEPQQETESLRRVGNQLLKAIFRVDSVTAALAHIQRTPIDEMEEKMLAECKRFFANKESQPEALSLLWDASRYSQKQREEVVRRAYSLAKVWLAKAELGLEHTGLHPVKADQRPCLIGVDTGNVPLLHDFQDLVRTIQSPGDSPPYFLNIGEANKGAIVFYNELGGVPAFYPNSVTTPLGLRQAYNAHQDKEELHIDKNRFQFSDLIPKTTEEARRYADSLKAFVLGRLLGLLKVKEIHDDGPQPIFHYSYKRHEGIAVEEVSLGDEQHAVDYLYRDQRSEHHTDRQILLRDIEGVIETLRGAHLLWMYGLLLEFYLKMVYVPVTDAAEGRAGMTFTRYSPEFAVLDLARRQIERMLPDAEERQQLLAALEQQRHKPQAEDLTYDEFVAALSRYSKPAGKVGIRVVTSIGNERPLYRDVLALDLAKVQGGGEKKPKAAPRPAPAATAPQKRVERPCPRCGEAIDVRAVFCIHCKQTVAQHLPCPHCGERVASDLEYCWKCGSTMRQEPKIECPNCYSFMGYASEFPCPHCQYDLATGQAPAAAEVPPAGTREAAPGDDGAVLPAGEARSAPEPTRATPPREKVECPNCFSLVDPDPRCSVCQGLLGTN